MKYIYLATLVFAILFNKVAAQCSQPGLKIVSEACDTAHDLRASYVNDSQVAVSWKGAKNRYYMVEASYSDQPGDKPVAARISEISCDSNYNYHASVFIKPGSTINWTVQTRCTIENAVVYSAVSKGNELKPGFSEDDLTGKYFSTELLSVHPNPSQGYISLVYKGDINENSRIRIFDVSGKQMLSMEDKGALKEKHSCKLDLHHLTNGIYLLELSDGTKTYTTKFEILRK